ncbi:MAG: glycine betaine catabolism [Mycobacterium sp.]|nr:glycine betaine catabolism [Mycobacterium sp.]
MRADATMMTSHQPAPVPGVRPGWALPRAAYHDPAIFRRELTDVFHGGWLLAATSAQVANLGDTLTWTVGPESVLLVRTAQGNLSAMHNTCRHRGCRIKPDGTDHGRALVCPYHNWAYRLDGSFVGAPHMGDAITAELQSDLGLAPVSVREFAGLVFVCFAENPPPIEPACDAITAQVARYRPEATQIVSAHHYEVAANWKVLVENNRECYHCSPNHPEFCLSNYELGMSGDSRTNKRYEAVAAQQRSRWEEQGFPVDDVSFPDGDFFRVARLPLKDGFLTESMSGRLVGPLLGDLTSPDVGSVRIVTLPNSWIHVNADYVMATRLTPIDENTTHVDVTFQVREGARAGIDYEIDDVAAVWVATSEQDWALCENTAAGIASSGYRPGPLSPITEISVMDFHAWWAHRLGRVS